MFRRVLTQMSTNSKPPALSLQRCPRIPDGVYLIAGKICGGITKPVTLLNYRVQADTAYTAPVSGPDHRSPLFKLRCSKHAVSIQLQTLSSPSPSDCCGEVFFRGYHPPSLWTSLHKYIYTCKHAPTQTQAEDTGAETPDEPRRLRPASPCVCTVKSDLFPLNSATMNMVRHASLVSEEENGDVVTLLTWKRKNTEFTLKLCQR